MVCGVLFLGGYSYNYERIEIIVPTGGVKDEKKSLFFRLIEADHEFAPIIYVIEISFPTFPLSAVLKNCMIDITQNRLLFFIKNTDNKSKKYLV